MKGIKMVEEKEAKNNNYLSPRAYQESIEENDLQTLSNHSRHLLGGDFGPGTA